MDPAAQVKQPGFDYILGIDRTKDLRTYGDISEQLETAWTPITKSACPKEVEFAHVMLALIKAAHKSLEKHLELVFLVMHHHSLDDGTFLPQDFDDE